MRILRNLIYPFVIVFCISVFLNTACKEESSEDLPEVGTVKDSDGNIYHTVTIGSQVWMVENLKTTKYRNGDEIAREAGNSAWATLNKGAYCEYSNNAALADKFGRIYNWHAVNDSRKIAPAGWHIPTQTEVLTLISYLEANHGTSPSAVKALAATSDWTQSATVNAVGNNLTLNNSSGFSAVPGGIRGINGPSGTFGWMGESAWWWSSNALDSQFGLAFGMSNQDFGSPNFGQFFKTDGLAVRCIKD